MIISKEGVIMTVCLALAASVLVYSIVRVPDNNANSEVDQSIKVMIQ